MRISFPTHLRHVLRQLLSRSSIRALLATGLIFGIAFLYFKRALWRDPHAAFFNSDHVYDLGYSQYRATDARRFIDAANGTLKNEDGANPPEDATVGGKAGSEPLLCAAYTTVRRDQKQYLDEAIGSMLAGLDPRERAAINLTVLFADTDPATHPNWKDPWLRSVVDDADTYNGLSQAQWDEITKVEKEKNYYVKGVLYVYTISVLSRCFRMSASSCGQ